MFCLLYFVRLNPLFVRLFRTFFFPLGLFVELLGLAPGGQRTVHLGSGIRAGSAGEGGRFGRERRVHGNKKVGNVWQKPRSSGFVERPSHLK